MNRNDVIIGGIALVVGVLLGLLFAPRGASVEDINAALDERLASVEGATVGVTDGIAALQGSIADSVGSLDAKVQEVLASVQSELQTVGERLDALEVAVSETASAQATMAESLSSELAGQVGSLGSAISAQTDALQSGLEGFRESLAMDAVPPADEEAAAAGDSAQAAATGEQASAGASAADTVETADEEGFVGIGAGRTAIFGDGILRVFVSRVDPSTEAVRVSVNGATAVLAVGETLALKTDDGTDCQLTLSGVQGSEAALNAGCGDELPEAEGARPGNIMLLHDGLIRVFVSGIVDQGEAARIAINGVDTRTVHVGESVDVDLEDEACAVTVDAIDRGHVALSASCG